MSDKVLQHPEEYQKVLYELAKKASKPGARFLEIGCDEGIGSSVIGKVAKECGGTLECVDPWCDKDPGRFQTFKASVKNNGLENVVIERRGMSQTVLPILDKASFDFIYVDANHTYDNAKIDILNSFKLLKQGGLLCGHDLVGNKEDYDIKWLEDNKNGLRVLIDGDWVFAGLLLLIPEIFGDYIIRHKEIWEVNPSFFIYDGDK